MGFVTWHLGEGVKYYLAQYVVALKWIAHYFSLSLLLPTLFSPWKRQIVHEQSAGFNLGEQFQVISFNFISRFLGAFVRLFLLAAGLVVLGVTGLSGLIGLLFWVFVPIFSYEIYKRFRANPGQVTADALKTGNYFKNPAGKFVLMHIGLDDGEAKKILTDKKISLPETIANYADLMRALAEENAFDEDYLRSRSVVVEDIVNAALWWDEYMTERTDISPKVNFGNPGIGLEILFGYTPLLNKHSTDLAVRQDFSHHLVGRQGTVSRIERSLKTGSGIVLTGEPGVGKHTVILEFARRASHGELGLKMAYRRVLEFDYNFVFSESVDLSRKKVKLVNILEEAAGAGNIVLVVRDLHRLINQSIEGMDFTDVFEQLLSKRKLKIIAVSTNSDYEKYIVPNSKIRKYFETIEVKEVSQEDAMHITVDAAREWENLKNLIITTPALRKLVESSERYITDTPFPEKALELLDAVIAYHEKLGNDRVVDEKDVSAVLSEKTGVSFSKMTESDKSKLINLEEIIHERLVNQDVAVTSISRTLRAKSVGVVSTKRPIGSFLFLGPTGVGKTETAKVLSRVYFGSEERILRFDMAEYSSSEGVERLLGSVTNKIAGELVGAIRNNPASLLLLDEIEKAPPKVLNLLLALLDEGSITDVYGKKVVASSLFIIATSNAGDEYLRQELKKGKEHVDVQKSVIDYVLKKGMFSPELINRFDAVVVYEPLSQENLVKIARVMLETVATNLKKQSVEVSFEDSVVTRVATDGYDPAFGARPMRRLIENNIADTISTGLLKGNIKPGDNIVVYTDPDNSFAIRKV